MLSNDIIIIISTLDCTGALGRRTVQQLNYRGPTVVVFKISPSEKFSLLPITHNYPPLGPVRTLCDISTLALKRPKFIAVIAYRYRVRFRRLLHNYTLSFIQRYKLICLKIPSISPLGQAEFLIRQGHFHPLYYYQVGPRVPLKHSQAALCAIVVTYIQMPLYNKWFCTVTSRRQGTL